jgi:GxxExxY protein
MFDRSFSNDLSFPDCRFSTACRALAGSAKSALARGVHCHGHMEPKRSPLSEKVIGCAIEVHRVLGPGLLESVYEQCLAREFTLNGLRAVWQAPLPIEYKGVHLDCGYRIDCVVEDELLIELKTVERVLPLHHAQILTYLKLLKVRQGLLINFNSRRLIDGLKSFLA